MRYKTVLLPLAVLVANLAPAGAQTLAGETLISSTVEATGQCNAPPNGSGFSFSVAGAAAGPYTGTFTESGDTSFVSGQTQQYPEARFGAGFSINAPNGDVSGFKDLKYGAFLVGSCTATELQVEAVVGYFASGPFSESGQSTVRIVAARTDTSQPYRGVFEETFIPVSAVVLMPAAATNPVGTSHTVTAFVTPPSSGVTVQFFVSGSVNTTGSCVTDSNGQCSFTYQGPQVPGADFIQASAGPGAAPGFATKAWILVASTPGQVTGGGHILHNLSITGVSFGFTAKNETLGGTPKGGGMVVDHTSNTKIKLLDVTMLVVAGTHATFSGNAEINGAPTMYHIDVDDLGEPGTLRDTFKIVTDSGYSAAGVLTGGNIQIHK